MNDEMAPRLNGYSFLGSNRSGESGKHAKAGVGMLIPENLGEESWVEKGKDFLAVGLSIHKREYIFISVYVAHENVGSNFKLFTEVGDVIKRRRKNNSCILVGGDMNAHLSQFAGTQNMRGKLLMEFAEQNQLCILNLTDLCEGRKTRYDATIDYALCNQMMRGYVRHMRIHEDQSKSKLSDHNMINIELEIPTTGRNERKKKVVTKTDNSRVAELSMQDLKKRLSMNQKTKYTDLMCILREHTQSCTSKIKINQKYPRWSTEIQRLDRAKKDLGKKLREARKAKASDTNVISLEYQKAIAEVNKQVRTEIAIKDKKMYEYIIRCPRNQRAKRFWSYIRKTDISPSRRCIIKNKDGTPVAENEITAHLTEVLKELLGGAEMGESESTGENPLTSEPITEFTISATDVKNALQNVANETSSGPDAVSGEIIKKLGEAGQESLANIFTRIIRGEESIPSEWREGRVVALEKKDSKRGDLTTYRPITITSILYRVFARVINRRIHDWIEQNGILGEMQNGYRRNRRGDDCLFILTSAIEIARAEKRGFKVTFLDCSKAYDKVDREKLWEILRERGMPKGLLELLIQLNRNTTAFLEVGGKASKKLKLDHGLRQGCALSPTLFMLYISRLETKLIESGNGIKIRYSKNIFGTAAERVKVIPGLLYADDLCLMTHTWTQMKELLRITTEVGDELKLVFNPNKSAVIDFNETDGEQSPDLEIQGQEIPNENSYKYLGVQLSKGPDYLTEQNKA